MMLRNYDAVTIILPVTQRNPDGLGYQITLASNVTRCS